MAQALEYGFWVQSLSFEAIRALYAKHHDEEDFDSAFTSHFEAEIPEAVNTSHHLVVVATGMDASTEQIVEYVRGYGVPINVLFFEYLDDGGREYLARSWLTDPELEAPGKSGGKKQAPGTKSTSLSPLERTTSATGTTWSATDSSRPATGTNTARRWRVSSWARGSGPRSRAAVPREGAHGYVGVGRVTAQAVGVNDFDVEVEGATTNILQAPLEATNMGWDSDDPELCEYLVRVEWIDTSPREQAVWEKGMFANQNVVAKLRQPFTLQRLNEVFDLDEDTSGPEAAPPGESDGLAT